jgi:hypothetical protein
MTDKKPDASQPIDAEFEPAEVPDNTEAKPRDKDHDNGSTQGGPGWLSFAVLLLIALGAFGLSLWSSGLLQKDVAPSPKVTNFAAVADRQDDIGQRLGTLETDVRALTTSFDALEEQASTQTETVAPPPQPAEASISQDDLDALTRRLEQLDARIEEQPARPVDADRLSELEAAIEDAGSGSGEASSQIASLRKQVSGLQQQLDAIEQAQAGLDREITETRQAAEAGDEQAVKQTRAALTLSAIETAAANGEPFEEAYNQLRQARPDDGDVAALQGASQRHTRTVNALIAEFQALKPEAVSRDTPTAAETGWVGALFGETVSVRRSDPDSQTVLKLAEASDALERRNLAEAIAVVSSLPEESRAVFGRWLSDARARQQLEQTLAALRLKFLRE